MICVARLTDESSCSKLVDLSLDFVSIEIGFFCFLLFFFNFVLSFLLLELLLLLFVVLCLAPPRDTLPINDV